MAYGSVGGRQIVPISLGQGVKIKAEVTNLGGPSKAGALDALPFKDFTKALEKIAGSLVDSLRASSPDKASVELGIEIGLESGQLTALLVKGTGTANLKVTLEWSKADSPAKR